MAGGELEGQNSNGCTDGKPSLFESVEVSPQSLLPATEDAKM